MTKDWHEWHHRYDNPNSSITLRLAVVQRDLRRALTEAPRDQDGVINLITMCAGEGRDVLPVLAEQKDGDRVKAILIEYDPTMSERARAAVEGLSLYDVEVKTADAGTTDTYHDLPLAQLLTVCSVFGNIPVADVRRTIATMPVLLADDGIVIWTRSAHDPSHEVRRIFLDNGFTEMSFTSTQDDFFWVGMHRLSDRSADIHLSQPGTRMFNFF